MALSIADQIALDDALVAPADRLRIGKCNLRLSSDVTSKEATLQVVYDVLKLTPFYKAFQVTADAPEIYMQEFWSSAYVHNRSVRFKMNNKKHIIGLEQFRDILQICPRVGNKKFVDPPLETEILIFLASLGHSGDIRKLTDVNVNKLHQPWRSFAAVINKCLSGTPSYDSLRLSQASNLVVYVLQQAELLIMPILFVGGLHFKIENLKYDEGQNERTQLYGGYLDYEGNWSYTRVVPDAPNYDSEDDISWKSSDDDQDDEQNEDTEEIFFVFSSSDDEDSDDEDEGKNVVGAKTQEEATDTEDQGNEEVKDTNTDLDERDKVMTDVEDTHVTLTPYFSTTAINNYLRQLIWTDIKRKSSRNYVKKEESQRIFPNVGKKFVSDQLESEVLVTAVSSEESQLDSHAL
ncbi:hypothetical protein Tco_0789117 [Tanacetum coccineum]